jgi:hypothetical protein
MPTISPIVCGWTVPSPPNLLSACYNPHESASGFRAFFNAHDLAFGFHDTFQLPTVYKKDPRGPSKSPSICWYGWVDPQGIPIALSGTRFSNWESVEPSKKPHEFPTVFSQCLRPCRREIDPSRSSQTLPQCFHGLRSAFRLLQDEIGPPTSHTKLTNPSAMFPPPPLSFSVYSRMRSTLQGATQTSFSHGSAYQIRSASPVACSLLQ